MADVEWRIAAISEPIAWVLRQRPVRTSAEALAYCVNRVAPGIREQAAQSVGQTLFSAELKCMICSQAIRHGPGHIGKRGTDSEKWPAISDSSCPRHGLIEIEIRIEMASQVGDIRGFEQ